MNRIINFHEVYDHRWFEGVVTYLKSKYTMVSMDHLYEFYSGGVRLNNACHLTIDDGEKSFYDVIFPVLKKYNVPVSLFVSPKIIQERSNYWFQEIKGYDSTELKKCISSVTSIPYKSILKYDVVWILKSLTIDQIMQVIERYQLITRTAQKASQNISIENLYEIAKSGLVSIGAHTLNHPVLMNEDSLHADLEISSSVKQLSEMLGHRVKYFAYPNGTRNFDFTDREERILENNGIQLAVTTERCNLSLTDNRMRVPRFGIPDCQKLSTVKTKLMLGSYWNMVRNIVPPGEIKQRNDIARQFQLQMNR